MKHSKIKRIVPILSCGVWLLATATSWGLDVYLRAGQTTITLPDGRTVPVWGFAQDSNGTANDGTITVPGPKITIPSTDTSLTIYLKNTLPEPVSIVIPGQPAALGDPVRLPADLRRVRSFTHEAAATTGTATYTWNNLRAGTFLYHSGSHPAVQVQMGLYGALVVEAPLLGLRPQVYAGIPYDTEVTLLLSEMDADLHDAVAGGTYGPSLATTSTIRSRPQYYLINGNAYPAGPASIPAGVPGYTVLLRLLNAGLDAHVPVLHNVADLKVIAEDGNVYPYPRTGYALFMPALKTMDVLFSPTTAGLVPLYDRRLGLANGAQSPGGMLTYLSVGPAVTPVLAVSPGSMSFNATVGGANPAGQLLGISNLGIGTLNWTATVGAGTPWLTATPGSGTGNGNVTVNANLAGLVAGTYNGIINVSATGAGASPQVVNVSFVVGGPVVVAATSFTNPAAITIPNQGAGTPYPSVINVTGTGGTISNVTVRLRNLTHTFVRDIDVLLVGPTGQKVLLASDAGPNGGANNITFTLSDAAAAALPQTALANNASYRPANYTDASAGGDNFPGPAPGGPHATTLSTFNGTGANGAWSLYVFDDGAGDVGSFAGGWSLTITTVTTGGPPPPPVLVVTPASLSFSATAGGANPAAQIIGITNGGGGTMNWTVATNAPWLTVTPVSGTGNGIVTVNANIAGMAAGTSNATITVSAPGAGSSPQVVNVSLVVGTVAAVVATTSFTNPAAITIPDSGAGTPYPSVINVSGTGGTISNVTVRLRNLTHTWVRDIDVLLVGPTGQKVLLASDAGPNGGANNITFTLSDAAAAALPQTALANNASYRPANYTDTSTGGDNFPGPAPVGPHATTLSTFNGTGANGAWSLYVFDDGAGDLGSFAGGWSLTITTVTEAGPPPPAVLVVTPASLSFSATAGGANPAAQIIGITNGGGGTMNWTVATNAPWLTVTPVSGTGNGIVTVNANIAGMAAGTSNATITVSAPGAGSSPQVVNVSLVVNPVVVTPVLVVSPASLSFNATAGGANPAAQVLGITNGGGGTMNWTVATNAPWLTVTPESGTGNGIVTVNANIAGMAAGTSNATITVSAPGAGSSPQVVNVSLVVGSAGVVGTTSFTNPAAITIPDSGAGTPYPSVINVTGTGGTISNVTVRLRNLTHSWTRDIDVLLVGPTGQKVLLASDAGPNGGANNITFTLSDAAAAALPQTALANNATYRPANYTDTSTGGDNFPGPAPVGPHATTLSTFNGTGANGAWSLYVFDDGAGDVGSFAGGWSVTITTVNP